MASLRPTALRCEYLVEPHAVDNLPPRLSWELACPDTVRRGMRQSAYQIAAASSLESLRSSKPDLWDSGKVASAAQNQVEYAGTPLRSRKRVYWRVRVWDEQDRPGPWSPPASFAVGLLKPEDWKARWIGHPAPLPPIQPARNGYHSALTPTADAPKVITLDLGEPRRLDAVRLWPARPYDWPDTPGFLFPLRYRVEAGDAADGSDARVLADRTSSDAPNPGTEPVTVSTGPVTARYVRLVVTRMRLRDGGNHAVALAEMEVLDGGRNIARGARANATDSIETGAWSTANLTDGDTVSHDSTGLDPAPAQVFRRVFRINGAPRRAMLYITALGVYEARVNGRLVGPNRLAPEWTNYHKRIQYQAYPIQSLLRSGANTLEVTVADGWACGRLGIAPPPGRAFYGRDPALLAQLEMETAAGTRTTIASDEKWQVTRDGPVRMADILDGVTYDATREQPRDWVQAGPRPAPSGRLVAQPNEPIRAIARLQPTALTQPARGVWVYDLGQNMVGTVRLRLKAPRGTQVRLRFAEMLNEDGTVYVTNLRSAKQTALYTARGGARETFEPNFTYFGFRYVEVTGEIAQPGKADLEGVVFNSASPEVSTFACDEPMLNRLWSAILWTQRANLMSTPTDCPQRDERMGWMGDIQAFAQTAIFNMDMAAFFTKWLRDVRDDQADDGRFPDFAPMPYDPNARFSGVPAWGDAGTIVPWTSYVNYGDLRLLREMLPAARRWVDYIRAKNPDGIWRHGRNNDYNDWLNGDTLIYKDWPTKGGAIPNEVFATAFYQRSAWIVHRMAALLGEKEIAREYGDLAESIRGAFQAAFLQPDGRITGYTQAGYALALHFGLVPDAMRPAVVEHMVEALRRYGNRMSTGMQTSHRLMLELTAAGRLDLAYGLLLTREFPSWGYMMENGATTIWERWDGYVKGRGFQNPGMNSFNHWAFGSVGEWMARVIGGLNPLEEHPAYARFLVWPRPGGGLKHASFRYRSIRGEIRIAWRLEGDRYTLEVVVPPNTRAEVRVAAREGAEVRESGAAPSPERGVRPLGWRDGAAAFEVGSGTYRFESRL